MSFEEEFPLYC